MVSTAFLAAGTINAKPISDTTAFGFAAYTCFQMIQAPNPIGITSCVILLDSGPHRTSPPSLMCLSPDTAIAYPWNSHLPLAAYTDKWDCGDPYTIHAHP